MFYSVPFAYICALNAQGWPGLPKVIWLGVAMYPNKLSLLHLSKYIQPELTISRQHLEMFRKCYTCNWDLYSLAL